MIKDDIVKYWIDSYSTRRRQKSSPGSILLLSSNYGNGFYKR